MTGKDHQFSYAFNRITRAASVQVELPEHHYLSVFLLPAGELHYMGKYIPGGDELTLSRSAVRMTLSPTKIRINDENAAF